MTLEIHRILSISMDLDLRNMYSFFKTAFLCRV